jgi:hypothetical protein
MRRSAWTSTAIRSAKAPKPLTPNTRSPTANPVTSAPTSLIVPANSPPTTNGSGGRAW